MACEAILHASFVQRQTFKMSDVEPASKTQLGLLVAYNRSRYSLVPRVDVRQCRQTLSSQCFTGIFTEFVSFSLPTLLYIKPLKFMKEQKHVC